MRPYVPALVSGVVLAASAPAWAQLDVQSELEYKRRVVVSAGQAKIISLTNDVKRLSYPDESPFEVTAVTPKQLVITGNTPGKALLTLFDKADQPFPIVVEVVADFSGLEASLKALYPKDSIKVASDNGRVVLSGEVSDARLIDEAEQVARLYSENVVNLLRPRGGQQVQLEVKFAEVSTSALKEVGFSGFLSRADGTVLGGIFSSRTGLGSFVGPAPANGAAGIPGTSAGPPSQSGGLPPVVPSPSFTDSFHLFGAASQLPLSVTLDLLAQEGLSKTLAEPTLVALSGETAKFLAGGEFPIPTGVANGQVSVQFKEFGVVMQFTPIVLGDGVMQLKLLTEVSDIDPTAGVTSGGVTIPGVVSRRSETTVRMSEGESFAIAGLISDRVRSVVDKVPFLGDIPVLGMLFRSSSFQRDQSELLVVITPHLVESTPVMPELPGEKLRESPSNLELFLLGTSLKYADTSPLSRGTVESGAAAPSEPAPTKGPEPSGRFGFSR